MQSKRVLIWELFGVLFLILVGSFIHFFFEWTGSLPFVGVFWTIILFSVLEYFFIKDEPTHQLNNFILAKALGVLSLQGILLVTIHTYTAFTGTRIVLIDLVSYIVGAMICQFISYYILVNTINRRVFRWTGLILLIANAVVLSFYTSFC